jgi:cytolysin-activating lysine-acyltransferase
MSKDASKLNTQEVPGHVNSEGDAEAAKMGLEAARAALSKLPILGPALWLYARDTNRKFMFMADIDWAVLPPVILDQCRLYTKNNIPFAFFTWAMVSDAVDQRLRSGTPRIAPHEWQSGEHLWLIDAVVPFGQTEQMIDELRKTQFPDRKVSALLPDTLQGNRLVVREWISVAVPATDIRH